MIIEDPIEVYKYLVDFDALVPDRVYKCKDLVADELYVIVYDGNEDETETNTTLINPVLLYDRTKGFTLEGRQFIETWEKEAEKWIEDELQLREDDA